MVMESDLVIQETTQTARSYHENVRQKPSDALWLATSAFRPSFFSAVSAARPQMSFRSFRQNRQAVKDAYAAERGC